MAQRQDVVVSEAEAVGGGINQMAADGGRRLKWAVPGCVDPSGRAWSGSGGDVPLWAEPHPGAGTGKQRMPWASSEIGRSSFNLR